MAILPIENENHTRFCPDDDYVDLLGIVNNRRENRRGGHIVVPEIVVHELV